MKPLRVFVADDEPLSLRRAISALERCDGVELVGSATDGHEALNFIRQTAPDVALLDIEMPHLTGLDVAESLSRERCPIIIFLTAYDHYAVQAFAVDAADYLMKPLRIERLQLAVARARQVLATTSYEQRIRELEALLGAMRDTETKQGARNDGGFWVQRRGERVRVPFGSIEWLEAQGDYVMLHCDESQFLHRQLLKEAEDVLDPESFCRIHRSAIVRIDRVTAVRRSVYGGMKLALISGRELTVGRKYDGDVRRRLVPQTTSKPGKVES